MALLYLGTSRESAEDGDFEIEPHHGCGVAIAIGALEELVAHPIILKVEYQGEGGEVLVLLGSIL